MIILGLMGYNSRTSLLSGLTVAQISEFSLILVSLGLALNHISSSVVALVTLVGIITIAFSTYMIIYGELIYRKLSKYLKIFERKNIKEDELSNLHHHQQYDIVLFGAHRAGYSIVKSLVKSKEKFLIIDYDPEVISRLKKKKIDCFYGDISNTETLNIIRNFKPKVIISTVPSMEDNLLLLKFFKSINKKVLVMTVAKEVYDVLELYKRGADLVILPELLTGAKISDYLKYLNHTGIRKFGRKYYKSLLDDVKKKLI